MQKTPLNRRRLKTEERKMLKYLKDNINVVSSIDPLMEYEKRIYFETIYQAFKFFDERSFSSTFEEFKVKWEKLKVTLYYTVKEQYIVVSDNPKSK